MDRRARAAARTRAARRGESLAAAHLEGAGMQVLDRNWRDGRRELDLVALDGDVVAFVEVKTRHPGPQHPLEAVGWRKRREIRRAAEAWIHGHPGVGREFRFDVVGVLLQDDGPVITHVPAAFRGEDAR